MKARFLQWECLSVSLQKIYDRATKKISYGEIPPYSVVVPGTLPSADKSHSLSCAVIVKNS